MAHTRIIGDIHGYLHDYEILLAGQDRSVQVGDFGIGFAGSYWHDKVNDLHRNTNHRFIRGNHDNPGMCPEMVGWIPDMTVEGDVMYVGGAWSIDWGSRVDGVNWWSQTEELSPRELYEAISVYEKAKPRVMITHDCPTEAATHMFFKTGLAPSGPNGQIQTRTAAAFQTMFEIHQPDFWFYGHWHFTRELDLNGTHFHCLGELDFVDFDFEKMDYVR
jgi:hypothetical protein